MKLPAFFGWWRCGGRKLVAQGAQEPEKMFLYFRSGSEISDTGFSPSGQYSRRRETHPESQLPGISYFCDEAFLLSCLNIRDKTGKRYITTRSYFVLELSSYNICNHDLDPGALFLVHWWW